MNYCKNCHKNIDNDENSARGLCWECYREYLLEKVRIAKQNKENPPPSQSIFQKFSNFIKKIKSRFFS